MVRASLIWLNYNSSHFIDIVLKSINSVLNLNFDSYEVIIVDNASSDGSFEEIKKYVNEHKQKYIRVKFVRSSTNRGYAGGMNLGWKFKDPETKYVVFLNNDLFIESESLREIINYMESDEKLAAVNGLIYFGDGRRINTVGNYGSENWNFRCICYGTPEYECPGVDKLHYVTYASGAYMVVKTGVIKKVCPDGKPFIDETFMYIDDALLGLILWNKGYKVAYVPVKSGLHYESTSTKEHRIASYYGMRAFIAIISIVKTRFQALAYPYIVKHLLGYSFRSIVKWRDRERYLAILKGINDGLRLARHIKSKCGVLDLSKAPFVPVNMTDIIAMITGFPVIKNPPRITFEMLKQSHIL
jgi:GT2 family glycosyltransferase